MMKSFLIIVYALIVINADGYFTCPAEYLDNKGCQSGSTTTSVAASASICTSFCQQSTSSNTLNCCLYDSAAQSCSLSDTATQISQSGSTSQLCWKCPTNCVTCIDPSIADDPGDTCDTCATNYEYNDANTAGNYCQLKCPAGQTRDPSGNGGCLSCPANTWKSSSGDASVCTSCPTNSGTNGVSGSQSKSACLCQPGFTGNGDINANPYCTACSVNTYKTTTANSVCTTCPPNSDTNNVTSQTTSSACLCRPGFTGNGDINANPYCTACSTNTHKTTTANTICTTCSDGSTATSEGSLECLCSAGYEDNSDGNSDSNPCLQCAIDTWKSTIGSGTKGGIDCTPCAVGEGTDNALGSTSETACECRPGYFMSTESSCQLCPINTFKTIFSDEIEPCTNCATGTGTNGATGSTNSNACSTCIAGYTKVNGTCTECSADTYKISNGDQGCTPCEDNRSTGGTSGGTSAASCNTCSPGFFDNGTMFLSCTPCEDNTYKSSMGIESCTPCPSDKTTVGNRINYPILDSANACVCMAGWYYIPEESKCEMCTRGKFKSSVGDFDCTDMTVTSCAPGTGYVSDSRTNVLKNKGSTIDDARCINCVAGQYKMNTNKLRCEEMTVNVCPPGFGFSSVSATTGLNQLEQSDDDDGLCTPCSLFSYKASSAAQICIAMSPVTCGSGQTFVSISAGSGSGGGGATADDGVCNDCPTKTWKNTTTTSASDNICNDCHAGSLVLPEGVTGSTAMSDCLCDIGLVLEGDSCVPVAVDKYKTGISNGRGTNCPEGSSTNGTTGSTVMSDCLCDVGYGGSPCSTCTNGKYQTQSSQNGLLCSSCGPGKVALSAAGPCTPCSPGLVQDSAASTEYGCKHCSIGRSFVDASTTCAECLSNTYQNENSKASAQCKQCENGQIYNNINTPCSECSSGLYSVHHEDLSCQKCNVGTEFVNKTVECSECMAGKYQASNTQTSAACLTCTIGRSFVDTSTICAECVTGRYQASNTQTSAACLTCSIGRSFVDTSTICAECVTGRYQPSNSVVSATCSTCSQGRSTASATSLTCEDCLTGKYQHLLQSQIYGCLTCLKGTAFVDKQSLCTDCSVGTYQDSNTDISATCKFCNAGTMNLNLPATVSCTPCSYGKYQDENNVPNVDCKYCQRGKAFALDVTRSCSDCIGGKYQSQNNLMAATCQSCGSNLFANNNSIATCQTCPTGLYQHENANPFYGCKQCPVGKFFSLNSNSGQYDCLYCNSGRYSDENGQEICKDCLPGYYTPTGGTMSGTFNSVCLQMTKHNCP